MWFNWIVQWALVHGNFLANCQKIDIGLLVTEVHFKPGRDVQSKGKSFETRAWTAQIQHLDQGPKDEGRSTLRTRTRWQGQFRNGSIHLSSSRLFKVHSVHALKMFKKSYSSRGLCVTKVVTRGRKLRVEPDVERRMETFHGRGKSLCPVYTSHYNLSFLHSEASSWSPQSSAAAPLASDSAQHHEASLQCL